MMFSLPYLTLCISLLTLKIFFGMMSTNVESTEAFSSQLLVDINHNSQDSLFPRYHGRSILADAHSRPKRNLFVAEAAKKYQPESSQPFQLSNIGIHRSRLNITGLRLVLSDTNFNSIEVVARLQHGRYMAKANNGQALWIEPTFISNMVAKNQWTLSATGCTCLSSDTNNCACCVEGSCTCFGSENICVPCDEATLCIIHGIVNVDAGVAFSSQTSSFDNDENNEEIVILSDERDVSLYYYKNHELQERKMNMNESMIASKEIESLDYEEFFSYDYSSLRKRRLLFVFSKSGTRNQCFEILRVGRTESFLRIVLEWSQRGNRFKVLKSIESRLLIGNQNGDSFQIKQIKVNKTGNFKIQDYQTMKLRNLDYWSSFNSGQDYYLLLKSSEVIQLYVINQESYSLFQEIELSSSERSSVVPIIFPQCGEKAAVVVATRKRLDFHVQDVEINKFVNVWSHSFPKSNILPKKIDSFATNSSIYLILPTTLGIEFHEVFASLITNSPEMSTNIDMRMLQKMQRIQKEFVWQESVLSEVYKQLQNSFLVSKQTVDTLRIKSHSTFGSPIVTQHSRDGTSKEHVKSYYQKIDNIEAQIGDLDRGIEKSIIDLEDVIPLTGSDTLIKGMKYFYGQKTHIEYLNVNHSFIGDTFTDAQQLDSTIQTLVRKNDERLIRGIKTFNNKLHISDLQAIELNGRGTNRLVTTYQPSELEGARYLARIKVKGDVLVGELSKVDGIDLSSKIVRLHDHNTIGTCQFKNLNAISDIELDNDIVNSKPFNTLTRNIFSTNGDVVFPGSIILKDFAVQKDLKAYTVMGVDFDDLFTDLVYLNRNENLQSINFRSEVLCGDLTNSGLINNDIFPKDFISNSHKLISFGSQSFEKVNFGELTVSGLVDSLYTSDIVTKSTPQIIGGKKTFLYGMKVYGDLNIHSNFLDGVEISLLFMDDHANSKKTIVFGESVTMATGLMAGNVNGVSLKVLSEDLVYKDDAEVVLTGKKFFLKSLKVQEVTTFELINDIPMSSFVTTKNSRAIDSHKIFSNKVIFEDIVVNGLVDNSNISDILINSLYLNAPNQHVLGEKIFVNIQTPSLFVEENLNRKNLNTFLTKSSDQTLRVAVTLGDVSLSSIKTFKVILGDSGFINGQEFSLNIESMKNVNVLDENVLIRGDVFMNNLNVLTVNNYKIKGLQDLLLRDREIQHISNNVAFQSLAVSGPVITKSRINENSLNLMEFTKNVLKLHKKNIVLSNTEWEEIVVEEINVGGLVNGINIGDLERDSVFLEDEHTLSLKGQKVFLPGFNVYGNLESNTINNMNLRFFLLSRTTPQNVVSPFNFESVRAEHLELTTFNGFDVDALRYMENKGDYFIKGPVEFGGFVDTISLKVDSYINHHNLRSSLEDSVELDGRKIAIKGMKNFVQTPGFDSLVVLKLNGQNLDKTLKIHKLNRKKYSLETLIVYGNVTAPEVIVGNINFMVKDNFLSPSKIREKYVVLGESDAYDNMTFDNLIVLNDIESGHLNGLNISKDLLTRSTEQVIWQPVIVSALETMNVSVDGKVNGILLPEKLYTEEDQVKVISGDVHFRRSPTIQSNVLIRGKIGTRKLSMPGDLVLLNSDSQVKGHMNFSSLVVNHMDSSTQQLNGVALTCLDSSLNAYRNLFENEKLLAEGLEQYISMMKNLHKKECKKISYLQTLLSSNLVKPKGFDLVYIHGFSQIDYKIPKSNFQTVSVDVSPVVIFKAFSTVWMLVSMNPNSCSVDVYSWDDSSTQFKLNYTLEVNVGYVIQWAVLDETADLVSLIAVSSKNDFCGSSGSSFWRAKHDYKLQRINSFPFGERVVIDTSEDNSKVFHIEAVNQIFTYAYNNGKPFKAESSSDMRLDLVRRLRVNNKAELVARLFDGYNLKISNEGGPEGIPMSFYIEDLALLKFNGDIILIMCTSHDMGEFTNYYIQASKYEDSNLIPLHWFEVSKRTRIYALQYTKSGSEDAYVALLEDSGIPRIYKIGGKPIMILATEFPLIFNERVWIESFVDFKGDYHLIFGDSHKALITRLKWIGRRFQEEAIDCVEEYAEGY